VIFVVLIKTDIEMRIALVLRQKKQDEMNGHISQAVVFNVENDRVIGVENETVDLSNLNSLFIWVFKHRVKEIYIPDVDDWVKLLFHAVGVTIKRYDELEDNKLFQTFIV